MKKLFLLIFLFLFLQEKSFSQQTISIEKVIFEDYGSEIPHAVGGNMTIANKINSLIKEHFMIDSFDPKNIDGFRWYDLYFEYEIKSDLLSIDYAGEYAGGPYPNYVDYYLLIDLKSGKELTKSEMPFTAFFTMDGYYEFLDKYWIEGVKAAFQEAKECAEGSEPYCSVYDVSYGQTAKELSIHLTDDCYPHALLGCSPNYSVNMSLEEVEAYLNDFGKQVLIEDGYASKSLLDKYLYYEKYKGDIPDNAFLVGKIDAKYPFKMALHIDSVNHTVKGYYYYEKNKVKIDLAGRIEGNKIYLTESLEQKVTGHFEFVLTDSYQQYGKYLSESRYLSGFWYKPDKSKSYRVEFEITVFNKS